MSFYENEISNSNVEINFIESRVEYLSSLDKYSTAEIEIIIFNELDELGLKSELYLNIVDSAVSNFLNK